MQVCHLGEQSLSIGTPSHLEGNECRNESFMGQKVGRAEEGVVVVAAEQNVRAWQREYFCRGIVGRVSSCCVSVQTPAVKC